MAERHLVGEPDDADTAEAFTVLAKRTAHYADRLGAPLPKVTVADAKSRWGSCKPGPRGTAGSIRYSWRLALAPFEVADYVAAHECAHLLELNHGPKFWAHVRRLIGAATAVSTGNLFVRVPVRQSYILYRYLQLAGQAPVRLVLYPGEGHGNSRGASRYDYSLRLMQWMTHYLTGPGGEPPAYEIEYGLPEKSETH